MTPAKKLLIVVAIQALILGSVIAFKQYTVWTGETVLLRVQPVDPRDPFRGDYITVRYEISDIDIPRGASDDWEYIGESGYVELEEGRDGYWHAVGLHDTRTRSRPDTVLIKARVDSRSFGESLRLRFGIEDVFIPEGSGDQLPWGRDHIIAVKVKVDRFGNAVAQGFHVDGEPFHFER
jgi:uncharacterized membrane-anchored protein